MSDIDFEQSLIPPNAVRLEDNLITTFLTSGNSVKLVLSILLPEMFYNPINSRIYYAIASLVSENQPIDIEQVCDWLDRHDFLEKCGGRSGLFNKLRNGSPIPSVEQAAKVVAQKWEQRRYQDLCRDAVGWFQDDLEEGRLRFEQALIDLKRQVSTATVISMSDLMLQATETLGDRYEVVQQGGDIRSENMPTGVQVLDDILDGGIPRQRLVYILGGTGMGKTSFGLQMARYCAVEARQPVLFFSIEMTGESQAVKMFSSVCEIPLNRLNSANFNCEDFGRMYSAVTNYDSVDFYIDDKSRTINDICLKSKQFAARHGDVGIILIDYLALIKTNENSGNRVQQIEGICYELNQLKKDLNTRVVVLSQIGRAVKERNDKRPQINDAKESGAVEETADLILSCYRDEYYNRDTQSRGTIELAVLKNRYGREGTATAIWQGQYSRIVNIQTEVF